MYHSWIMSLKYNFYTQFSSGGFTHPERRGRLKNNSKWVPGLFSKDIFFEILGVRIKFYDQCSQACVHTSGIDEVRWKCHRTQIHGTRMSFRSTSGWGSGRIIRTFICTGRKGRGRRCSLYHVYNFTIHVYKNTRRKIYKTILERTILK